MAEKIVGVHLDFDGNQIRNVVLQPTGTALIAEATGQIIFDVVTAGN